MSNTIVNDNQITGKKESLFQKSTNLNLHLDKFAILNSNKQISIKSRNTREYNNLKDNLKVLMNFEHSIKFVDNDIVKNSKRNKIVEDELKKQFNDLNYVIEAKYKGAIGIEKTKDDKIKFLYKQPKKLNENSNYIFIDDLKSNLKSFDNELHNFKRLLKQSDQMSDNNKEYLEKVNFQKNLIQLLDIKKINTKAQKEKFYEKAYDTLISFQEEHYNFRINKKDKSNQVYNFVQHKIKDSKIVLTNKEERKINVEQLYRALDFNSKHTKNEVIESFKQDHLFNKEYIDNKVKDISMMVSNNKYDFKYNLDKELRKLRNDINYGVDLKSWNNKTIENRGVSKDLVKDFKYKLNDETFKDITNNQIDIVKQDLDKRLRETILAKNFDEAEKLSGMIVNINERKDNFINRMKNLNNELKQIEKIEIVLEVDNKIVDTLKVSKDEKINISDKKINSNNDEYANDFINDVLNDGNKYDDLLQTKKVKELSLISKVSKIENSNININDVKEIKQNINKAFDKSKSLLVLSKIEKLYQLNNKVDELNEWFKEVSKFDKANGFNDYTKDIKLKVSNDKYKDISYNENNLTYIDFNKATIEDIKNINIEDIERVEFKDDVLIHNENDESIHKSRFK